MDTLWRLLLVAVALLSTDVAWAQDQRQGWLGVELQDVSKEEADKLGWDAPRGAKVTAASSGSPAEKAGVKAGDIIVAVERTQIDTASELNAAIEAKGPGAQVLLSVLSGGRERRVTATLAERPKVQAAQGTALHLMLDTGGHRGIITGLAFTPDGRQIVSAGRDRVVRVWDWKSGKTVRTIRGQVGLEPWSDGTIYAAALSPDGHWLAVGGRMAVGTESNPPMARIYDFPTGKLLTLLRGDRHGAQVRRLAFSPDGKRLISQEFGGVARVWDVASGRLQHRLGHGVTIDGVGFTRDGRAVTGADDTTVRLWLADGSEDFRLAGHKDRVSALAVSPMDGTVVSGDWSGEIRRRESETGNPVRMLAKQRAPVEALHISPNGRWLLSADQFADWVYGARVWELPTGREVHAYAGHDNTVFALATSPDSRYAATGGGSRFAIHVWELETGARSKTQDGKPLALEGTGAPPWAVGFSEDGQNIAWGRTSTKENWTPMEFRLRLPAAGRSLGAPEPLGSGADAGFLRVRTSHGAYTFARRTLGEGANSPGVLEIKKDGQVTASVELSRGEGQRKGVDTFTPDGQTIISGSLGGWISPLTLEGKRHPMFIGHEGQILAVATSPDGRFLVSGSADQTVRLWNLETREPIVTLFHGIDGEWVMWTPQGYYTGSPGADKIVGWQINKGPDQAADYVGAEQLRQHLNRPDIVERAIVLASAEGAVREAPGTSFKLADLLARPVPRFKIMSPAGGSMQRGGRGSVTIDIEAIPDPVKLIRVHVNGRQVEEQTPDVGSGGFGAGERLLTVPLANGRNEVRIALTNAIGEKAESLTLIHDGEGALDQRGTLHILAIGVNDYKGLGNACGGSCDLKYSVADARKLAEAVEKQLGSGHARVVKRVLVNGGDAKDAPTAGNIIDAVELLRQARETDTVVLFISGHGKNEGPDYRFLPTDAEWTGTALRGSTVVPWQVLQSAVEAAKGRRVLFVDTCHSGNAYNPRLGSAAYHANIVAYTASRFDQEAIEDPRLGHGLFTYAMVEGLEGKSDLGVRRQISTRDLATYVTRRVEELAKALKGEQEPQYFKGRDADDYVLARW
jgi:WD40 repeat protein